MSRIEMYSKASFGTLENSASDSLSALKLQENHQVLSTDEMLEMFSQMRDNDMLESPAVERPELRNQPWLDVEPNVPHSCRPRIPPPTPPQQPAAVQPNSHQPLGGHLAQRIDSQSRLFEDRSYSPLRTPLSGSVLDMQPQQQPLAPFFANASNPAGPAGMGITGAGGGGLGMTSAAMGGASTGGWGLPPGLQRIVQPDSIQWVYTDPNGMHQGPFAGQTMNQWYLGGWLKDDLHVKRMQDQEFFSIGSLKQSLGTDNPFAFQTTQDAWDAAFGTGPAPAHLQQAHPAPLTHQVQSRSSTPFGGWSTPMSNNSVANISQSMWGSSHAPSATHTPTMSHSALAQPEEREFSGLLQELDIQSDEEPLSPQIGSDRDSPAAAHASANAPAGSAAPISAPVPAPIAAPSPIAAPVSASPEAPIATFASHASNLSTSDHARQSEPVVEQQQQEQSFESEQFRKEPEAAPWAAKRPTVKQAVNLAEIQAQEAAKRKEEQAKQRAAAQHAAALRAAQTPEVIRSSTPLGLGGAWGTPRAAAVPKRSVADIQREQALAQQKLKATAPQTKPVTAWSGPAFAEVVRPGPSKPLPSVVSGNPSTTSTTTAAAAAATTPAAIDNRPVNNAGSPWQTVNRKAKPLNGLPGSSGPASAGAHHTPAPKSEMKPASRTDELIQWCKNTFKQALSKDVNPDELLSLFLTLPNTPDAKDFITESIYSYSSTLDGRRFASDFIQRRKEAEGSLKPGETWDDILNRSNPDAAEIDPSFKVVTKKQRYRQIAKPALK